MSEWALKRFWKNAEVVDKGDAFTVTLDGRDVKTPAKALLLVPSRPMAEAIADEWQAQGDRINPLTMPVTRSANAALDKVATQHAEVAELVADYGGSDLICYRADGPRGLVERQNKAWDPLVDWSATALSAPLKITSGVMPITQSKSTLKALHDATLSLDPFRLTAFHDLVSLSGSLILGFAVVEDHVPVDKAWAISRIDEEWQIEQWGEDEEASEQAEIKWQAFLHADRFFRLC